MKKTSVLRLTENWKADRKYVMYSVPNGIYCKDC